MSGEVFRVFRLKKNCNFFRRVEDGAHLAIEFCFDKSKGRLVEVSIGTACYSLISCGHNRGFRPAYIAPGRPLVAKKGKKEPRDPRFDTRRPVEAELERRAS